MYIYIYTYPIHIRYNYTLSYDIYIHVYIGLTPHPATATNEGLRLGFPNLKHVSRHPGGDEPASCGLGTSWKGDRKKNNKLQWNRSCQWVVGAITLILGAHD